MLCTSAQRAVEDAATLHINDEEKVVEIVLNEVLAMFGIIMFHLIAVAQDLIDFLFNLVRFSVKLF